VDVLVQQHAVVRYTVTKLFYETRFCEFGDIDLLLKKCKSQKFFSTQIKSILNTGIYFTLCVRLYPQTGKCKTGNKLQLMTCIKTYMPLVAIKRAALMI
jgi:hypothetical protein